MSCHPASSSWCSRLSWALARQYLERLRLPSFLGAGAAVGTMAAVGAGALAGGAMASAGAKGAASASAGAVKAGASMAGGSKVAFMLGKMSAGGGVKGAIGGAGAVAQAGVMSVAKKGADMASKAGGAISTAHTRGMHGGLRALSTGMKPMPKPDGGSKGQPNWAKKVHRQQKTRNGGNYVETQSIEIWHNTYA